MKSFSGCLGFSGCSGFSNVPIAVFVISQASISAFETHYIKLAAPYIFEAPHHHFSLLTSNFSLLFRLPSHLVPHHVAVGGVGFAFVDEAEGGVVVPQPVFAGEDDALFSFFLGLFLKGFN